MNPKRVLRHTALSLSFAAASATMWGGGYFLTGHLPEPYIGFADDVAAAPYQKRLDDMTIEQDSLSDTTDEDSATDVEKRKRQFFTDVMLDPALDEKSVRDLAVDFNQLGKDDGIVFPAIKESVMTAAKRNECLASTDESDTRENTARRVDACMSALDDLEVRQTKMTVGMGAIFGFGLYGALALGRRQGRKIAAKP